MTILCPTAALWDRSPVPALRALGGAALPAAQVQRNFRLVSDASFVPPFTVGTRASAHTFAAGVEHHLPAVTFGARRVRFAPCVVGGTSYHTIKFANNGDTPVRPASRAFERPDGRRSTTNAVSVGIRQILFAFDVARIGPFSIRPHEGLVQPHSVQVSHAARSIPRGTVHPVRRTVQLVAVRFAPMAPRKFAHTVPLVLNYSSVHTVQVRAHPQGVKPSVTVHDGAHCGMACSLRFAVHTL